MSLAIDNVRDIYADHLNEIYKRCPEKLMASIREAIMPASDAIADAFYTSMLTINGADAFLVDEIVDARLKTAMTEWIRELFKHRDAEEVAQYVERQLQIGSVHARVNLPPHLLNTGIRVVKLEIHKYLLNTEISTSEYRDKSTLMGMVIDVSASLMNESYLGDLLQGERKAQSLQMHVSGQELAFRCEKFRADIFS
ncbi:MAG: protoglobin domain-containing protein [Methylococcaceae bacterium]